MRAAQNLRIVLMVRNHRPVIHSDSPRRRIRLRIARVVPHRPWRSGLRPDRVVMVHPIGLHQKVVPRRHQLGWASLGRDGWGLSAFSCPRYGPYEVSWLVGQGSGLAREARPQLDALIATFIAIIINSLDDTKRDRALEGGGPVSRQDLVRELRATRETLERLEERLNVDDPGHEGNR